MATTFESINGIAFTKYNSLDIAEWAVKGVKLRHDETDVDAFACARVVDGARTYPRVLRLGIYKDESMVKDYVWRKPRGEVLTYALPRHIEDFSDFFRGEPQPWKSIVEDEGAASIRGIYRALVQGGAVQLGESAYIPAESLKAEALGTPPTYVL